MKQRLNQNKRGVSLSSLLFELPQSLVGKKQLDKDDKVSEVSSTVLFCLEIPVVRRKGVI